MDRADSNEDADNARLNITCSCDVCDIECQTLEEMEAQKNSYLVKFRTEEANSCSPCKRQFKHVDDLMDHIKWYHKTCADCVKHGVMSRCVHCATYLTLVWN